MAERCAAIAHELGYPAITKPITFLTGGTDAAEGAKVGLRAVTLMAMPWDNAERAAVYHTPDDNVEAIEPAAVEAAMAIAIRFVQQLDEA
jgi:aminopeptidase YwaD